MLEALSLRIPLVMLDSSEVMRYELHQIAAAVFNHDSFVRSNVDDLDGVVDAALKVLDRRGEIDRLMVVVMQYGSEQSLAQWLERCGGRASRRRTLRHSRRGSVPAAPASLLESPRLLLLQAGVLREQARVGEAMQKAEVAKGLAELAGDDAAMAAAHMTIARLHMDVGDMSGLSGRANVGLRTWPCRPCGRCC